MQHCENLRILQGVPKSNNQPLPSLKHRLPRGKLVAALAWVVLISAPLAEAEWRLNNARSQLSFVTVKAGDVAEVHSFAELHGSVAEDGGIRVAVDLASVDTLIPIRDQRMRELLFETAKFPTASIRANIAVEQLQALVSGQWQKLTVDGTLKLREAQLPLKMDVLAVQLADGAVLVASSKPLVVNAASVGLVAGVEQLRQIVGLPSISRAVPVSFVLVFERGP